MNREIFYGDGVTRVELGDEVEFRGGLLLLFKRFQGRVVYVPGISPLDVDVDMESDGLSWIAIDVPGDVLVRVLQTFQWVIDMLLPQFVAEATRWTASIFTGNFWASRRPGRSSASTWTCTA